MKVVNKVKIFCDGASRGNPGPASAGAVLLDENGVRVSEVSQKLGITTNNVAEYTALILALEKVQELNPQSVHICADSQLMIRQLNGEYRVKHPQIRPLYERARQLLEQLPKWEAEHIRRELNREADALANAALDAK